MAKEISQKKRKIVYEKYNKRCAYCGIKLKYEDMQVDHIIPKYRGSSYSEIMSYGLQKGTNDLKNLNPSCKSCNCSKSTFTLEKWKKQLKLKHERLLRDNSSYKILHRFKAIKYNDNIKFYFEKYNRNGRG